MDYSEENSKIIRCGKTNPTLPKIPPENPKPIRIIREKWGKGTAAKFRKIVARKAVWKSPLDNYFWAE